MEASEVDTWLSNGFIQKFLRAFRTSVPGKIVSYDVTKNTATIAVAIQDVTQTGQPIPIVIQLFQVPVIQEGGQENYISCPLAVGDLGTLVVCDRDIDNFKAAKNTAPVASQGVANLKDSFFVPGLYTPINATGGLLVYSATQITLQAGSTTFVLGAGGATMTGNLTVEGTVTANEDVVAAGISLKTHVHGGVQTGTGETGAPVS